MPYLKSFTSSTHLWCVKSLYKGNKLYMREYQLGLLILFKIFVLFMDTIFASQVWDSLTLINPVADLVSDYRTWASNQIALGIQHENNMNVVSRLYFKWVTAKSCLNNTILFSILGILYTNINFSTEYGTFCSLLWEKGDNSYQPIEGSDTRT